MQETQSVFQVDKRITYHDRGKGTRTGKIIEVDQVHRRCRIVWDNGAPRSWIRMGALTVTS